MYWQSKHLGSWVPIAVEIYCKIRWHIIHSLFSCLTVSVLGVNGVWVLVRQSSA